MYFVAIIIGIAILSFVLALRSLKALTKSEEIGSVKQELKKGKILFRGDTVSSASDTQE